MFPMTSRALIAFLLGAWLAGTLFLWAAATQNFRIVDRMLGAPVPEFRRRAAPLAEGDARLLMRHQASEVNRLFFERWGWTQLALGALLVWLVFRAAPDRALRLTVALMLLIAAATQFAVVPETVRLGRLLDFAPRSPAGAPLGPEAARFWRLHGAYTGLDMLKFFLGIFATVRVLRGA